MKAVTVALMLCFVAFLVVLTREPAPAREIVREVPVFQTVRVAETVIVTSTATARPTKAPTPTPRPLPTATVDPVTGGEVTTYDYWLTEGVS